MNSLIFFNTIISPIVNQKDPNNFLKRTQKKKLKIKYIDGGKSAQILNIPTPNRNEHKDNSKSILIVDMNCEDSALNHRLEQSIKRYKIDGSNNKVLITHTSHDYNKQTYDF